MLCACYDQDNHANIPHYIDQVDHQEDHKEDYLQLRILSDAHKDELSHNWWFLLSISSVLNVPGFDFLMIIVKCLANGNIQTNDKKS